MILVPDKIVVNAQSNVVWETRLKNYVLIFGAPIESSKFEFLNASD
jgi:hypothetical protein